MNLPFISAPNSITNADYHNSKDYIDFISSTTLKQLEVSPKYLKYYQDNPKDSKRISLESNLKGSVYHAKLCSIANCGDQTEFNNSFVVFEPPINPSTKKPYGYDTQKFTDTYTEFQTANPGKEICSKSEIDLADAMIEELLNGNPHLSHDIRFLLKHGKAEISHFCEYQGGLFKYRTDLKTTSKIIDWKTCQFGRPKKEEFAKQIVDLGYDISASFYQFFDHLVTGRWRSFYWVAQEKEPPYDFNIIDASNWAFSIKNEGGEQIVTPSSGAMKFIRLLEEYLICKEKNFYPGYSIFTQPDYRKHRIAVSPVPGYVKNDLITFYN